MNIYNFKSRFLLDNSYKWSNIGYGEEIEILELKLSDALLVDVTVKRQTSVRNLSVAGDKVKVTTDRGVSETFDTVVVTAPVAQILQLEGDIAALIGMIAIALFSSSSSSDVLSCKTLAFSHNCDICTCVSEGPMV